MELVKSVPEAVPTFDDFWLLYVRREGKKDARKAWSQMTPDQQLTALTSLAGWRVVHAKRETQHIPLPASWLRGERYEDELPREFRGVSSTPVRDDFKPLVGERKPMPDNLRHLLAGLRK